MDRTAHLADPDELGGNGVGIAAMVVAIHIAAIVGLVAALNRAALIKQIGVIQAAIFNPKEVPRPPPPPPPDIAKPKPLVAVMPQFMVQHPPLVTNAVPQRPAPVTFPSDAYRAPAREPLRRIMSTHIVPLYPPIARRLGEEGSTSMEVAVAP